MPSLIDRPNDRARLTALLRDFPVVALIGPRQVGKSTLARQIVEARRGPTHFFDLERDADRARLADPMLTLGNARGLVVIDDVQHVPELFRSLRVLADEHEVKRRFLVLGSAAPALLHQSSESLAGRIAYHELHGFRLDELGVTALTKRWLRGGFPRSFLARSDATSYEWRDEFLRTFLERDVPQFGVRIPSATLRRFWLMLTHYHAQTWNSSELARAFGVAHTTVHRYLDVLTETFMLRQLPMWHENISKRQVRAPKIYIRDSGLLHTLLAVHSRAELEAHPKVGASWEGFALDVVLTRLGARDNEAYGWATHTGAELDLLVMRGHTRIGVEFKRTSAPTMTPSMRIALGDLHLDQLYVVHGGTHTFPLHERVKAVPLARVMTDMSTL